VARLGVADHMGPVPVAIDELAAKTSAHGPSLYRVMRLLASLGVFAEHDGRRFSTTDVGQLLKTNAPNSLRSLAIMYGDPWTMRPYEHLTHSVLTGGDGVQPAFGKPVFELLSERRDEAQAFQRVMSNLSAIEAAALLEAYDFSGIASLCDVGGGHGTLLGAILRRHAGLGGVLFDLPQVVAGAQEARISMGSWIGSRSSAAAFSTACRRAATVTF